MNRLSQGLLFSLCLAALPGHAAAKFEHKNPVDPNGVTKVAAKLGNYDVAVVITTHSMDIGTAVIPPDKRQLNCTYARFPCVVIDHIDISVNGHALFVPRAAYGALTDISDAQLKKSWGNEFELNLHGGDPAKGYSADIVFERERVTRRTVTNNESGQVVERTSWPITKPVSW